MKRYRQQERKYYSSLGNNECHDLDWTEKCGCLLERDVWLFSDSCRGKI